MVFIIQEQSVYKYIIYNNSYLLTRVTNRTAEFKGKKRRTSLNFDEVVYTQPTTVGVQFSIYMVVLHHFLYN